MPLAFASGANGGIEQTIGTVHAVAEFSYLGADVAVGDRIFPRAVDLNDLSVLHRYREAARIGTIERTGRFDDGRGPAKFGFSAKCHRLKIARSRRFHRVPLRDWYYDR
jgi:hypothetical protein